MPNHLFEHPVLQHLPYELLRNPDTNNILSWLEEKRSVFRRIRIIASLCIPLFVLLYILTHGAQGGPPVMVPFEGVLDAFMLLLFPALTAVAFYYLEKKYRMRKEDVENLMQELHPGAASLSEPNVNRRQRG